MENSKSTGIGFFEKYLIIWVALCMAVGVLIGKFLRKRQIQPVYNY